ncbi:restriction endonuclease subunit S [Shewanella algae]|uniref:restriction endonuclease subunit S n=1 Tax=Shewanella algae TaxID=38313 RepID=UPI0016562E40|nr:restriction endonuclease subunit S [Shewanella algae]MBC8798341.1 restriction endonuclease subunit S [Shewanella algae]
MSEQATLNNKYVGYADYKDSRVEELGRLPATWGVKKVNYLFSFGRGLNITKANLEDTGIPVVNYGEVHSKYGFVVDPVIHPLKCVSSEYLKTNPGALLRRGDFVFADTSEDLEGAGNFTHFDGSCDLFAGYHTVVLRPQHDNLPRFLAYAFDSLECRSQVKLAVKGVKVFSVTQGILKDVALPVPPIEEQRTIAAFLDYETARIDSLIDKQQRLIELLKEKRQAVISHAVTKGLNPAAPIKDSGVEWLGQVPEHWAIAQLKFNTLTMQTGPFGSQLHAEDYVDGGIPLVNPAHMSNGNIVPDPQVSVDLDTQERLGRHKLKEGDIIFARRGELGRCAVVKAYEVGWLCGTGSLKATLNERLIPEYAYLLITSDGVIAELSLESKGSTMDNLNTETLGKVRIPVPPISEQREILVYVEDVSGKFKELVEKAEIAIKLMQERRTALISAAVTGKIDLRGWTQPVKEDAA